MQRAAAASTLLTKWTDTGAAPVALLWLPGARSCIAPGTVPAAAARTIRGAARPSHLAARRRGYSGERGGPVGMSSAPDIDLGSLEQRLFDLAADPLVVTCTDGRVLRVNRAACVL